MSATTDFVSSPVWILFAKNRNKSAVRRNSFSQSGVKPRLPMAVCGPALTALSTAALCSLATGALSSIVTGFASSRGHIFSMTSAPTTIRYSGTSTSKSLSCLITRTVRAPSANPGDGRASSSNLCCRSQPRHFACSATRLHCNPASDQQLNASVAKHQPRWLGASGRSVRMDD
jgi:hypothetical protein